MIRWAAYLQMLKEDGVTLETSEHEAVTDEGERLTTQFLLRWIDGVPLPFAVELTDLNEPVPRRTLRQVANALRLPVEKYVFPENMS